MQSDFMGNDRQITQVIKMQMLFLWHLLPITAVLYHVDNNKLEIGPAECIVKWPVCVHGCVCKK